MNQFQAFIIIMSGTMKRSEMVVLLAIRISTITDYACSLQESDKILKEIEEDGMLPPEIDSGIPNLYDMGSKYMINEWEPEDST